MTLDIDDTCDVVHGHQQLSLFNAHYDARCFLPIHVYDRHRPPGGGDPAARQDAVGQGDPRPSAPAARHIRQRWPSTRITIRGDGHYGRVEVMDWCEANGVDDPFGLPGNAVLDRLVDEAGDDIRTRRALEKAPSLRGFAEIRYRAKSWKRERRACARIEATTRGLDIRFVVTNLEAGSAEHVYEVLYCAREAENLIKLHKTQLASDRTSCRSPLANQVRFGPLTRAPRTVDPHFSTAAYWLMLGLRDAIPKPHALAVAEFATLRLKLLIPGLFDPGTAPASSKPAHASVSPSPQPARTRRWSATSPSRWPDPEQRGQNRPAKPLPQTPSAAINSRPTQPGKTRALTRACPAETAQTPRHSPGVMNKTG